MNSAFFDSKSLISTAVLRQKWLKTLVNKGLSQIKTASFAPFACSLARETTATTPRLEEASRYNVTIDFCSKFRNLRTNNSMRAILAVFPFSFAASRTVAAASTTKAATPFVAIRQIFFALLFALAFAFAAHAALPTPTLPPQKLAATGEKKVVRLAFRAVETGFDPQKIEDRYSIGVAENLFESLLTYDWLARPVKLAPQVAESVPEGEEGGTRFTFRIKPGILFSDDPVFKGQKRELVAKDMEYAIKRFRDPAVRSPYSWLFEDKIVGLDEYVEKSKKDNRFDYDFPIEGIKVVDKYTISFKLRAPDFNFIYFFAMPNVVPVAREVIEAYGSNSMAHPVGTGPYVLAQWVPASKIVLERNPNYRGHTLSTKYADEKDEWDRDAVKYLAGKTLPLIDRVEIYPIEQEQPRFLAFMNAEHDYIEETPLIFVDQLYSNGKLTPIMTKRNARVFREEQPEITYDAFNMDDKFVGGYKPENIALRRAIVHAHDRNAEVNIVRRGQAAPVTGPIPKGVVGFDPTFAVAEQEYNPARSKALLDMFGYLDKDGDGFREMPDGRDIVLEYKYQANEQEQRERAALWVKNLAAVGLRLRTTAVQFADLLKDRKVGKFQMSGIAWIADYPDAQNFLQLLYGPNTDISNDARFKLAEYDKLYSEALKLPDGPERNKLYREMNRVLAAYAPWRYGVQRTFSHFLYPWVRGYKKHPILYTSFKYLDIDVAAQQAAMQQ
jgi:oligopeptide transport system substrate-binding protein